jgi:phosphate uptake regulator
MSGIHATVQSSCVTFILAMSGIAFVTQVKIRVIQIVHPSLQIVHRSLQVMDRRSRVFRVPAQIACSILLRSQRHVKIHPVVTHPVYIRKENESLCIEPECLCAEIISLDEKIIPLDEHISARVIVIIGTFLRILLRRFLGFVAW